MIITDVVKLEKNKIIIEIDTKHPDDDAKMILGQINRLGSVNDAELKIKGMLYDEMDNRFSETCERLGGMKVKLGFAYTELFLYQKIYGRIDIWEQTYKMKAKLCVN